MNILFTGESWADYLFWQDNDKRMVRKINELIKIIKRTPFQGIGKPEPLKHQLKGFWSRRIDLANRLVYEIREKEIVIISCRYHYE
jgi:toxin YoeB